MFPYNDLQIFFLATLTIRLHAESECSTACEGHTMKRLGVKWERCQVPQIEMRINKKDSWRHVEHVFGRVSCLTHVGHGHAHQKHVFVLLRLEPYEANNSACVFHFYY